MIQNTVMVVCCWWMYGASVALRPKQKLKLWKECVFKALLVKAMFMIIILYCTKQQKYMPGDIDEVIGVQVEISQIFPSHV